jgi:excinuclease UvrABC helicase subunit UvrB
MDTETFARLDTLFFPLYRLYVRIEVLIIDRGRMQTGLIEKRAAMEFRLHAPYKPTGDQPEAISELIEGIQRGYRDQVLLGATGTGKTFTIANVIQQVQLPTLVMAHNKTLAAQLYAEFKEFFPNNAVEYFVSYYDYYQPEAYVPQRDLYIEKETDINEEIDRLRLAATTALMSRKDVIIVASVSCHLRAGGPGGLPRYGCAIGGGADLPAQRLMRRLVESQYTRNDFELKPGRVPRARRHAGGAAQPTTTGVPSASASSATRWSASWNRQPADR